MSQEFLLGDAENHATVIGVDETVTEGAGRFTGCRRSEEPSPPEPGAVETQHHAAGVGLVLGIEQNSGNRAELVEIIEPR